MFIMRRSSPQPRVIQGVIFYENRTELSNADVIQEEFKSIEIKLIE